MFSKWMIAHTLRRTSSIEAANLSKVVFQPSSEQVLAHALALARPAEAARPCHRFASRARMGRSGHMESLAEHRKDEDNNTADSAQPAGYPVMKSAKTFLFALLTLLPIHAVTASEPDKMNAVAAIEGTWTLAFADVEHPDGTRTHDYGDAPKGTLQIDHAGHYSLFVLDSSRPRFAANDKHAGTPNEFRAAALGASAHFGTVDIDPAKGTLAFHIEGATYPNWEGATQVRSYELSGDMLSCKVPPRPNGDIPLTGWKRVSH